MGKKAVYLTIVFSIVALGVSIFALTQNPEVRYIDLIQVFEGFQMQKDLSEKLENQKEENTIKLNGLIQRYNELVRRLDSISPETKKQIEQEAIALRQQVDLLNQEIQQKEEKQAAEYDVQIWTRINQYIREYGEEKKFDLILGTKGEGTVMYADTTLNETTEFVNYINKRYEN